MTRYLVSLREEASRRPKQYCEIIIVSASRSKHLVSKELPKAQFLECSKCSRSIGCCYHQLWKTAEAGAADVEMHSLLPRLCQAK